jgi:hypothetical protein
MSYLAARGEPYVRELESIAGNILGHYLGDNPPDIPPHITDTDTDTDTRYAPAAGTAGFAEFWASWPRSVRKKSKDRALQTWKRHGCARIANRVIAAVEREKTTADWTKTGRDGRDFIPMPQTWLNQKRYLDDPTDLVVECRTCGWKFDDDGKPTCDCMEVI